MQCIADSNDRLLRHPLWRTLYRLTGVPPIAVRTISLLVVVTAAIALYSVENVCLCLAFSYPALKSFECIQSDDIAEQRYWLSYWVVYGLLHFLHQVTDRVLYRVPYYSHFKSLFLLWCFLPPFRGAAYVYRNIVRPVFALHRDRIDRSLRKVKTRVNDAHQTLKSASSSLMPTLASSITRMAVQALTKIETRGQKPD